MTRALLLSCVLSCVLLSGCAAVNHVVTLPDREWERAQQKYPKLQQIDNEDWKSWIVHGGITVGGGYGVSKVARTSARKGRCYFAAFYVVRELTGLPDNHKRLDPFMDAAVPVATCAVRF